MLAEGRGRGEVAKPTDTKTAGGSGGSVQEPPERSTLSDLDIPKKVSARSGALARLDADEYEPMEGEWRGTMASAARVTLPKVAPKRESMEAPPLPEGLYSVAVIDPPWPMSPIHVGDASNRPDIGYATMTVDEITALVLPATDAHVFLWTTQRFLPDAFRCFDAWGVRYVCWYFWIKPGGPKPLRLPTYNVEPVLYGRIVKPSEPRDEADWRTGFSAPRGAHSEKPGVFYETIRRVYAGPRIDMFSRRRIDGFDPWGDESE